MTHAREPTPREPGRLRPGRPVLRRDPTTLQIGFDATAVRLPDTPDVRRLLAALDPLGSPLEPGAAPVEPTGRYDAARVIDDALHGLRAAGHLVDPATGGADARPDTVLRDGYWAVDGTVGLEVSNPMLRDETERLLQRAGLRVDDTRPAARLIVTAGPAAREDLDDLIRTQTPHLLVTSLEGTRRVGPFVVPGRTACLRCVDVHESAGDPRRPLLIAQAARAARLRPEPVDPATETAALAWAVRDLASYLSGGEPSTWSATIDLPPLGDPVVAATHRRWSRHPYCGCCWDEFLPLP